MIFCSNISWFEEQNLKAKDLKSASYNGGVWGSSPKIFFLNQNAKYWGRHAKILGPRPQLRRLCLVRWMEYPAETTRCDLDTGTKRPETVMVMAWCDYETTNQNGYFRKFAKEFVCISGSDVSKLYSTSARGGLWLIWHSNIDDPQKKTCVKYRQVLGKETIIITNFPQRFCRSESLRTDGRTAPWHNMSRFSNGRITKLDSRGPHVAQAEAFVKFEDNGWSSLKQRYSIWKTFNKISKKSLEVNFKVIWHWHWAQYMSKL